jgi:asparagine synthase (glutamine-hydrolysing)
MLDWNLLKLVTQLRHDSALYSYSTYSMFLNYCVKPLIPRPIKTSIKQILKPFRGNGFPPWINVACLKKAGVDERLRTTTHSKIFPTYSQQQIYNMFLYGWNRNIALDMLDRFGSHFGTESRYPFFDRRLVEFLFALPEEQRWKNEWTKTVLRHAMDGMLPDSVRIRKDKAEFSSTIDLEFKNRQLHKMEKIFQSSALAAQEIVHSNRLQQLFNDYQRGIALDEARSYIETLVWLELWYRTVMDLPQGGIRND